MIPRKPWSKYTEEEKDKMREIVMNAKDNTPFSPEYAAAYLGISASTLQYWRCHKSDAIIFSKVGRSVVYLKKDLDDYLKQNQYSSTTLKLSPA